MGVRSDRVESHPLVGTDSPPTDQRFGAASRAAISMSCRKPPGQRRPRSTCKEGSLPFVGKLLMQLEQFFRGMTLTRRATVQSPANLRLPFRIIFGGPPPQVLRQFQTLLRRQLFNSLFDLGNAHGANNAESRQFFNLFYPKGECVASPRSPATRAATARGQKGPGRNLIGRPPWSNAGREFRRCRSASRTGS